MAKCECDPSCLCEDTIYNTVRAVKKPIVVDVEGPVKSRRPVQTANGTVWAEEGDYILTDPRTNDKWPIKAKMFTLNYTVVCEHAAAGTKDNFCPKCLHHIG